MDEFIKLGYLAGATRFRRISDKLYIDGNKLYSDENVQFKASWFSVYYALSVSEKPLTVLDLANIIGFSHITVKNIIREMENENLVQIKQNIKNKRSKIIHLSEKGILELSKIATLSLTVMSVGSFTHFNYFELQIRPSTSFICLHEIGNRLFIFTLLSTTC